MSSPSSIAVVGGGFSGTLAAVQLLRKANSGLTVHLIERTPEQFARGVAYSTTASCHLLNVPAGNMSAFPDDPEHFLHWAKAREETLLDPPWVTEVSASSFLPRRAYGGYLSQVLEEAAQRAGPDVRLERLQDEAIRLREDGPGVAVDLTRGGTLRTDKAVLALGNFRPGNPGIAEPSFYETSRYHGDPWISTLLPNILATDSCLLIGSGLTMVDWALSLSEAGYRGTMHALSRRGLWPQAHAKYAAAAFTLDAGPGHPSVRAWLHQIRRFTRSGRGDWRAAVDALRSRTPDLWQSLTETEQLRFLHHLRPYWDCHRHRIAPAVATRLSALVESGQLRRHVGRIRQFRPGDRWVDVVIQQRGNSVATVLRTEAVLNCSGSESDYRKLDNPLVRSLLEQGLATPDRLRLGLQVGARGALLDKTGTPSDRLYTLGPPQKGVLWETTAVPEIRCQAANLAATLLNLHLT